MKIRIYYEDTDAAGVVYYANYFKFMERARTEWLRTAGFEQDQLRAEYGIIFVVQRAAAQFIAPARFNDLIEVGLQLKKIARVTLDIEQPIYKGDHLLCRGEIRIVCVDADRFRPKAIPRPILESIQNGI